MINAPYLEKGLQSAINHGWLIHDIRLDIQDCRASIQNMWKEDTNIQGPHYGSYDDMTIDPRSKIQAIMQGWRGCGSSSFRSCFWCELVFESFMYQRWIESKARHTDSFFSHDMMRKNMLAKKGLVASIRSDSISPPRPWRQAIKLFAEQMIPIIIIITVVHSTAT